MAIDGPYLWHTSHLQRSLSPQLQLACLSLDHHRWIHINFIFPLKWVFFHGPSTNSSLSSNNNYKLQSMARYSKEGYLCRSLSIFLINIVQWIQWKASCYFGHWITNLSQSPTSSSSHFSQENTAEFWGLGTMPHTWVVQHAPNYNILFTKP